jgi:bacterial/archaeal transporter family-2 protein
MTGSSATAVSLCIFAGLAGPVQAAVMGELGQRIGLVPAVGISAVVTVTLAFAALAVTTPGFAGLADALREPAWLWAGGALSVLIVFAVTVAPPRIGTTATIAVVIAGNLVMATAIDRFGLFGLERIGLGWNRLAGLAFLALGAALVLRR